MFNPYTPRVLFMGQRQTMQTKITIPGVAIKGWAEAKNKHLQGMIMLHIKLKEMV